MTTMDLQPGLWHEERAARPPSPARKRWGGRNSERARAHCRSMMPAPCQRGCGRIITTEDPPESWHAGHIIDRADGGTDDADATAPECSTCNTSAGGKRGAAVVNARRVAEDAARERVTRWW